jgi:hypothetical protein
LTSLRDQAAAHSSMARVTSAVASTAGAGPGFGGAAAGAGVVAGAGGVAAAGAAAAGLGASAVLTGSAGRASPIGLLALAGAARGAHQIADQGKLFLRARVGRVDLQGLVIGLAGEPRVDVAEVFVGGGIRRMGADGHFQGLPGLVELLLLGVDHGEVVVGFRQFRIILGQPGEYRDGFRRLVHLGQDDALEEASLGILGLAGQILVDLHQRLGILPLLDLLADVLQRIGMNRRRQQQSAAAGAMTRRLGKLRRNWVMVCASR